MTAEGAKISKVKMSSGHYLGKAYANKTFARETTTGNSKCTDDYGCSQDQGQADWPEMVAIGDDTPADILAFIEDLDADNLDEPYGCILYV